MRKLTHFLKTTEGKFVTFIAAIIVLAFAYYFYAMSTKGQTTGTVTVTESDHVRGALTGTVTLVEFGDFQCPACGAYEPIVRQVTADNADILKVVFKHFPLTQIHQNALLAAKASEAASNQGKFWEMHDMLYDNQATWQGSLNARDMFVGYATSLGLNATQFADDLNSSAIEDKIVAEYREGTLLGVQGTPTFFVNGKKIDNPQSAEAFNAIIKAASSATVAQ
jgi:formate-nitrite transporter family protein